MIDIRQFAQRSHFRGVGGLHQRVGAEHGRTGRHPRLEYLSACQARIHVVPS